MQNLTVTNISECVLKFQKNVCISKKALAIRNHFTWKKSVWRNIYSDKYFFSEHIYIFILKQSIILDFILFLILLVMWQIKCNVFPLTVAKLTEFHINFGKFINNSYRLITKKKCNKMFRHLKYIFKMFVFRLSFRHCKRMLEKIWIASLVKGQHFIKII